MSTLSLSVIFSTFPTLLPRLFSEKDSEVIAGNETTTVHYTLGWLFFALSITLIIVDVPATQTTLEK